MRPENVTPAATIVPAESTGDVGTAVEAQPRGLDAHTTPEGCSGGQPEQEWVARKGDHLEATIRAWAESVDWSVEGRSNFRWPIEASHRFAGDFGEAVSALLESFSKVSPAPVARAYCANRVVVLRDGR